MIEDPWRREAEQRQELCHDCRGTGGDVEAAGDCPTCGGWGYIRR